MRKWIVVLATILLAVIVISIAISPWIKTLVQHRVNAYLRTEFDSDAQVGAIDVWLWPRIRVEATDVVLRHLGEAQLPPLIQVRKLTIAANVSGLFHKPIHIGRIDLEGLQIHTPPRMQQSNAAQANENHENQDLARKYPVVIETVSANNALLVTLRAQPGKKPRAFPIQHLEIKDLSFSQPASFRATLTNPIPVGEIHTVGQLGPWNSVDPANMPVAGDYTFENANLATIRGISGILSSRGKFSGPLDYIQVDGQTQTPNFALRISGNPVDLLTDFSAIVDGTNGDTILKNVTGHFGGTTVVTDGKVLESSDAKGRKIMIHAVVKQGRIEDLLRLAMKSNKPTMIGRARLETSLQIPPGKGDIVDRMKLRGKFGVNDARFTSSEIQNKVDSLSRRGQGHPRDTHLTTVSQLTGEFSLAKGTVNFSQLEFQVTGAAVDLAGQYSLNNSQLDFNGDLLLQARLSQTTTGIKSFLLKAINPFFAKKGAGTDVPIRITGTREKPSFSLDFHHDKSVAQSEPQ
jgi:hypothetical protein